MIETELILGQSGVTFSDPLVAMITLVIYSILSVFGAGVIAIIYRWYFREEVPEGIAILIGVAVVALYINTASLGVVVGEGAVDLFRIEVVLFNVVALGVATAGAPVGQRLGDRIAVDVFAIRGLRDIEGEMGKVVRSVGRTTMVTLPTEIEDMDSYDPVSKETKTEMAGKRFHFPRRLTVEELRERIVDRIKEDYAVGYVDVDLTDDGQIDYLAVGSRMAGVGPTLAPGTVAIAVTADPPNNAAAGDLVQLWTAAEGPELVVSGELRSVSGDISTIAIDENDIETVDPSQSYRLVTLLETPRPDREFATLLRSVDETIASVEVSPESLLTDETLSMTDAIIIAVRSADGTLEALPARDRVFSGNETVYAIGRPAVLRRLEEAATTPKPAAEQPEVQAEPAD